MPLSRFVIAKEREISNLRSLAEKDNLPPVFTGERVDFKKALESPQLYDANGNYLRSLPISLIAEYKRASPSRGVICESVGVEDATRQYKENSAHAMSILTEEEYFKGNLSFLSKAYEEQTKGDYKRKIPLLRKDFLFDSLQIRASASTPASALLLIVRLTPNVQLLRELREQAESFGMHAVVEVFNEEELFMARESGAQIIQVNARDLQSFQVDRDACLALIQKYKPLSNELWIAASGLEKASQILQAADSGYHAVLVGSSLMESGALGQNLKNLMHAL